jgi:hypothetical protein
VVTVGVVILSVGTPLARSVAMMVTVLASIALWIVDMLVFGTLAIALHGFEGMF